LAGVPLGVLVPLFGAQPEDQRVAGVVRNALREMEQAGARTTDVNISDFPAEGDVSVIRFEFKFHLNDYLAHRSGAPVKTLADILDKRLFHPVMEQSFRRANEVASPDTEEYRAMGAKQARLRDP